MLLKKITFCLVFSFFALFLGTLYLYSISVDNFHFNVYSGTDQACDDMGGSCQTFNHTNPYGSCRVDGSAGRIVPDLCRSNPSESYRCCVPIDESLNDACEGTCIYVPNPNQTTCTIGSRTGVIHRGKCGADPSLNYRCCVLDDDTPDSDPRVISDDGCGAIGGDCQVSARKATSCTIDGEPGCFYRAVCRSEDQNLRDDQAYRCCVPVSSGWCTSGVDYSIWETVYFNGSCPFTKAPDNNQIYCSQGPYTDSSHSGNNAVDISFWQERGGGSEYFMASEGGKVLDATKYYEVGTQKCGGKLVFQSNSGITYTIMHVVVFESITEHFRGGGSAFEVERGAVLARIANRSDNDIIEFRDFRDEHGNRQYTCASGPHFHVELTGTDRCADCYFAEEYGCDLRNDRDPDSCGRCWRNNAPPGECEYCEACPNSNRNYCCEDECIPITEYDPITEQYVVVGKECKASH